tara:strand:- start:1509 stop:1853 length:345 start_codon:yes stop_codon:yes gene_type:complete
MSDHIPAANCPDDKSQDQKCEEYEEQDLCDACRSASDPAETKCGGDNGKNEKCECPTEHDKSPYVTVSGLLRRYRINSGDDESVPEIVQGTIAMTAALCNQNVRARASLLLPAR